MKTWKPSFFSFLASGFPIPNRMCSTKLKFEFEFFRIYNIFIPKIKFYLRSR